MTAQYIKPRRATRARGKKEEEKGMEARLWIRRDRETGAYSLFTHEQVENVLVGNYRDVAAAMVAATETNLVSSPVADYWPKPVSPPISPARTKGRRAKENKIVPPV